MSGPIVTSRDGSLKSDLREPVRGTVEDFLNGLLDEGPATWSAPSDTSGRPRGRPAAPATTTGSLPPPRGR